MTNYEVIVLSEQDPLTTTTTPPCFPCSECNRCMARQEFFFKDGRKYCAQCFGQTYGLKCAVCDKAIEGVSKVNFILYDNKVWHEGCFKCFNCRNIFNEEGLSKTGEHLTCTRCGAHVTCQKKR